MLENRIISVVGLGYVGLPVAVSMSKKFKVIGFDIKKNRINELSQGIDSTHEVQSQVMPMN
jgi:UDP-N-acetyl-D-glucosamine/UDP-N-acetyl-D-galactosamine dehydrogenase